MKGIKISFEIKSLSLSATAYKNDAQSLEIKGEAGEICLRLWYDWKEKPLTLGGKICVGDSVEAILFEIGRASCRERVSPRV